LLDEEKITKGIVHCEERPAPGAISNEKCAIFSNSVVYLRVGDLFSFVFIIDIVMNLNCKCKKWLHLVTRSRIGLALRLLQNNAAPRHCFLLSESVTLMELVCMVSWVRVTLLSIQWGRWVRSSARSLRVSDLRLDRTGPSNRTTSA
jgi:hypothetical protein